VTEIDTKLCATPKDKHKFCNKEEPFLLQKKTPWMENEMQEKKLRALGNAQLPNE